VLNEIQGRFQERTLRYWRDKQRHEVDFIRQKAGRPPAAVECKWSADQFDPQSLKAFRRIYPEGSNFVVCRDVDRSYKRNVGDLDVEFVGLDELIAKLDQS
jgi:hypothetical protein